MKNRIRVVTGICLIAIFVLLVTVFVHAEPDHPDLVVSSDDSVQANVDGSFTIYHGVDLSEIYDYQYYVTNNEYAKTHFVGKPKAAILYFGRYAIRKGVKAKEEYSQDVYQRLYNETHPFPQCDKLLDKLKWSLWNAFKYASKFSSYHGSDLGEYSRPYKKTSKWYYNYLTKKRHGNCYCKAGTFTVLANEIGYKCTQIGGSVPYRRGGTGPHSWVEIVYHGKKYVCDPTYYRTSHGKYGWMFHYGKKGTYRYSAPHKMKLK